MYPKMNSITIKSPAKVNLFLRVTGRRDDGFHEIYSLFQPISLYDELTVETSDGDSITVECRAPGVPSGASSSDNLAYRAADLLLREAGLKRAVVIEIKKEIPVGAGLGGGSGNAAAVLMALNELTGARFDGESLREMGAALGSDVPFFIMKSPAIARGRGEILEPITLPAYEYVLINPGFSVETARIYGNLDLTKCGGDNILSYSVDSPPSPEEVSGLLVNDLEAVTTALYPEITGLKGLLSDKGATGALMSGSGPTVFGVFPDRAAADCAFEALEKELKAPARVIRATGL